MDSDEYYKKCKTPSTWFFAGRQMYNAADILFDVWNDAINKSIPRMRFTPTCEELNAFEEQLMKSCDLFPVYMMLMGYALENISKGLELMDRTKPGGDLAGCSNLTVKNLDFGGKKGHRTLERMDRLEISLSQEEREAVKITDDHVIWAGKYGVPKSPGQYQASEGMPTSIAEWRKYAEALRPLFDRLYEEFRVRALRDFNMILG